MLNYSTHDYIAYHWISSNVDQGVVLIQTILVCFVETDAYPAMIINVYDAAL